MEKFNCAYSRIVPIDQIIENPKNNNRHSLEQIQRLAKIIDFQGQRLPLTVSKRSGFLIKGHCTLMAMRDLGWKQVAIDEQDFLNEAQEYAHMTADNEIAKWAELDVQKTILDLKEIDLGDIDLLGFENNDFLTKDLNFEPKTGSIEFSESDFQNFQHKCPKCNFEWNENE